ncbi:MAG: hypothetical protein EOO52_01865 [Gammaproteobacteria bacterium]|nr:MAG: hypothetical protein EOO52_01865 [Gammaproteobacteria bacterium]
MKLKTVLSIICLAPISVVYASMSHAETQVVDSRQVCEKRIDGYKSGLQAEIDEKKNIDAARAELDLINKLPKTLPACEKQKRIPALANTDETSKQTNEALKDRKISP